MNKFLVTLVILAAVFLAGAAMFAVYNRQKQTPEETKNNMVNHQAAKTLAPIDQQAISGNPDQIVNDVTTSFDDEATIASEGDSDVNVIAGGDGEVNTLMQQYNEKAF